MSQEAYNHSVFANNHEEVNQSLFSMNQTYQVRLDPKVYESFLMKSLDSHQMMASLTDFSRTYNLHRLLVDSDNHRIMAFTDREIMEDMFTVDNLSVFTDANMTMINQVLKPLRLVYSHYFKQSELFKGMETANEARVRAANSAIIAKMISELDMEEIELRN